MHKRTYVVLFAITAMTAVALAEIHWPWNFRSTTARGIGLTVVLVLLLFAIFVFAAQSYRSIRMNIRIANTTLVVLLLILVIGAIIRLQLPAETRHFADELIFRHKAQLIKHTGESREICNFGQFIHGRLRCADENTQLSVKPGYSFLLALLYLFFSDASDLPAFLFNIVLSLCTIFLVFILGRVLSSDLAGLAAAALIAVHPVHVFWSATSNSDVPALFFSLAGIITFVAFTRKASYPLLALSVLLLIFGAFVRLESIIILLCIALYLIVWYRDRLYALSWHDNSVVISTVIVLAFIVASVLWLHGSYQGTVYFLRMDQHVPALFSLNHVGENLHYFFIYFLQQDVALNGTTFVMTTLGIMMVFRSRKKREVAILIGTSCALLLFYLIYSAGNAGTRFILPWLPAIAVCAGIGFQSVYTRCPKYLRGITLLVFGALLFFHVSPDRYWKNSHLADTAEEYARFRLEQQNPQCLYVTLPYRELLNGFDAMFYVPFASAIQDPQSAVWDYPCLVLFTGGTCRNLMGRICEEIVENGKWRRLPYAGTQAWHMIARERENASIQIPAYVPYRRHTIAEALAWYIGITPHP